MSAPQSNAKSRISFIFSAGRTLAACWPSNSVSSKSAKQPRSHSSHEPPPAQHTTTAVDITPKLTGKDTNNLVGKSSDDLDPGIATGTTKPPYELSSRWAMSTQNLILNKLPDQLRTDSRFMTVLHVAFTTIASRIVRRDDLGDQAQTFEEKLAQLRTEMSKSEQDLENIVAMMAHLRRLLEFPDMCEELGDDPGGNKSIIELGIDIIAQTEGLLPLSHPLPGMPRSDSRTSLLSSDSSTSNG